MSKFQLISKFILKTSIDKSKSYYGNLKATEKIRNELVHNKSKDLFKWMQDKNMELCDDINEPELDETATFKNMIDKLDEMLQEAKTAIKSMRDIAFFFEEHDEDSVAMNMLFPELMRLQETRFSKEIKREFSIKI